MAPPRIDTAAAMERLQNCGLDQNVAKAIVDTLGEQERELVTRERFDDAMKTQEDKLTAKIDAQSKALHGEMKAMGDRLDMKIDKLDITLNAKIDTLDASLNAKIDATDAKIDAESKAIRSEFQAASSKFRLSVILWVLAGSAVITYLPKLLDLFNQLTR